ncbi:hypothetical protein [Methylotuvimicrobium buryatense]|uniref:Phosphoenolpyruvate carboxylase n=1 Tax=Methylotuvimicrobium buryatense TaxID=95641 RepID=A0A4P9UVB6_METBY|nr:hypothetical protein [Methylotuvimicrobium buryatense]QCW84573.1 hypothetical protein EQU24_21765 [Methylotuvimicrobium buryatense]
MSFDREQIAGLIRKLAGADRLLAQTYIDGTVFVDDDNRTAIDSLKKAGILRTADVSDEYRLTGDVKRLIDRLLLRNQRYQQAIDLGKMILTVEEDIEDYRRALERNEQDEARYHLEQIDDTLYEAIESLETSLSVMFAAITSQFGFVSSLNSKIRQNRRALAYAQRLVQELNQVDLNDCYDWLSWAAIPPELSRKIIRFIDQYKSIVERLTSIVARMKTLLFTLRLQEQTANRTRAMAQFLRQHPEWEPLDWSIEAAAPELLRRGSGLNLSPGIDTANPVLQADLVEIVQELRRQTKPLAPPSRDNASAPLDTQMPERIEYHRDLYESHIENLFASALERQGRSTSALQYWQGEGLEIKAELWLDMVFAQYCCLPQRMRSVVALEMQGENLSDFNGNQVIHEISLRRV